MTVIMFHGGKEFPNYLKDCFSQFRLFNSDMNICFLTDKQWMNETVFKEYAVSVFDKDDYHSNKIDRFLVAFNHDNSSAMYSFWVYTAVRLIYIENFMREHKLKNAIHFENDILIYSDLKKLQRVFMKLFSNMAITVGGPDKCMTGMMFIKSCVPLSRMTQFFIDKLEECGKKKLKQMYGMDMVNEMTLMRAYSKDYPEQLEPLPILPFGEFSKWYDRFNSIFDPASWGQYVGGNIQGKQAGLKPEDHYIGQLLRKHPEYNVIWKQNDKGRAPYFSYDGKEIKINNLHIHSKELYKYLS